MTIRKSTIALAVFVLTNTSAASAEIIFSNSILPSGNPASLSWDAYGVAPDGEWATSFTTPSFPAMVSEIRIAGATAFGDVRDNIFSLSIYTSENNEPASLVASTTVVDQLQCCRGSYAIQWISIPTTGSIRLEGDQTYWISASTPVGVDNSWFWLRANTGYSFPMASRNPLDSTAIWSKMQYEPPAVEIYGDRLPVSEPSTTALLFSGLGVIGFEYFRRRTQHAFCRKSPSIKQSASGRTFQVNA